MSTHPTQQLIRPSHWFLFAPNMSWCQEEILNLMQRQRTLSSEEKFNTKLFWVSILLVCWWHEPDLFCWTFFWLHLNCKLQIVTQQHRFKYLSPVVALPQSHFLCVFNFGTVKQQLIPRQFEKVTEPWESCQSHYYYQLDIPFILLKEVGTIKIILNPNYCH